MRGVYQSLQVHQIADVRGKFHWTATRPRNRPQYVPEKACRGSPLQSLTDSVIASVQSPSQGAEFGDSRGERLQVGFAESHHARALPRLAASCLETNSRYP